MSLSFSAVHYHDRYGSRVRKSHPHRLYRRTFSYVLLADFVEFFPEKTLKLHFTSAEDSSSKAIDIDFCSTKCLLCLSRASNQARSTETLHTGAQQTRDGGNRARILPNASQKKSQRPRIQNPRLVACLRVLAGFCKADIHITSHCRKEEEKQDLYRDRRGWNHLAL